jgi:hypothetical protein
MYTSARSLTSAKLVPPGHQVEVNFSAILKNQIDGREGLGSTHWKNIERIVASNAK